MTNKTVTKTVLGHALERSTKINNYTIFKEKRLLACKMQKTMSQGNLVCMKGVQDILTTRIMCVMDGHYINHGFPVVV